MSEIASPMVALMRECINTPCRGSDLGSHDLIHVVRQELFDSPIRRTAQRSSRKAVSFQHDALVESPSKSARQRRRSMRQTPRKPLSDLTDAENTRPKSAQQKRLVELDVSRAREAELLLQIQELQDGLEERDAKIERLTNLVKFLSAEVRIYTKSLESQVESQAQEIKALKTRVQG